MAVRLPASRNLGKPGLLALPHHQTHLTPCPSHPPLTATAALRSWSLPCPAHALAAKAAIIFVAHVYQRPLNLGLECRSFARGLHYPTQRPQSNRRRRVGPGADSFRSDAARQRPSRRVCALVPPPMARMLWQELASSVGRQRSHNATTSWPPTRCLRTWAPTRVTQLHACLRLRAVVLPKRTETPICSSERPRADNGGASFVARALVGGRFAGKFEAIAGDGSSLGAISSGERAGLYRHER